MATIYNKINYYTCSGGCMVGNASKGSASYENLEEVDVVIEAFINSQKVLKISSWAFYYIKMKSITLPDSLEEIGYSGIDTCALKDDVFVLPKSLKKIGVYGFSCNSIKKFVIGPNVEEIGIGAFSDNGLLESFEVSKENTYFSSPDNALYNKDITILYCVPYLLCNYIIPNTVKEMLHRSYNQLYALSIWVPHAITIIRDTAFFLIPNVLRIHIMGNIDKLEGNIIYGYKVHSFYYHGTKVYNLSSAFNNMKSMKIFTCDEYNYSFFGGNATIKFGSCFTMNRTCKPKSSLKYLIFYVIPLCTL